MSNVGFVNATLRTVTAGRLSLPNPDVPAALAPDPPTNLVQSASVGAFFWAIEWDAAVSNDDNGILGYKIYQRDVLIGTTSDTEFQYAVGITASTEYDIEVASYTIHKTSTTRASITITTEASGGTEPTPDTTPPTDPTAVTAVNAGGNTVGMTWGASTDAGGMYAYVIVRDGNPIDFVYDGTLTYTTVVQTSGLTHRFGVQAVDLKGNRSAIVYASPLTIPGVIVQPPAPRTISGVPVTATIDLDGRIAYVGPAPAARTVDGAFTTDAPTMAGTLAFATTVTASPTWVTPSVDTVYAYNEGDTVDIPLAATDYNADPAVLTEQSFDLPPNVAFEAVNRRFYGVLAAGTGLVGGKDYDQYVLASDFEVDLPEITTTSLPNGTVAVAYSATIEATGGQAPRYFNLVSMVPTPVDTWSLHPTTGALTCASPTEQWVGVVNLTVTDSLSNVGYKTLSLTIGAASTDNFESVATEEGVYYATNFSSVYIDTDDDGFAELQPARAITSKARLVQETLGNTGGGTLNADLIDWDTSTFGFPVLKMRNTATETAQGGDWQQHMNGLDGTLIRRCYLFFSVYFPALSLGYRYQLQPQTIENLKIMKLDDASSGQLFWGRWGFEPVVVPVINASTLVAPTVSSGANPWARTGYQAYNGLGLSTAWQSEATTDLKKSKFLADNGPCPRASDADFDRAYATPNSANDYAVNRLDQRTHPVAPGWPDPRAGGVQIQPDTWVPCVSFQEYNLTDSTKGTAMLWMANSWLEAPVLMCNLQNNVPYGGSGLNSWNYFQRLNYDTGRLAEVGRPDLIQYERRLVSSRKPIRFPNGSYPPGNLG